MVIQRPDMENGTYYHGTHTHRYINTMINSSSRMHIVSPYIDQYYARLIADKAKNAEFYIIASAIEDDAKRILCNRGSKASLILHAFISLILLYIMLRYAALPLYAVPLAFVPMLVGIGKYFRRTKGAQRIHLKVPRQFVHAKMYISEDQAILGSVNLTYKGTHSNVEHIDIKGDPEEVRMLRKEFWEMWRAY